MMTHCGDWREALDEAGYWEHECVVSPAADGWVIAHFDNPHNYYVDEIGHIEEVTP